MSSFSVFVGNIAPNVAEEDLVDLFSQVGRVRAARLARDKETGRAKQFGFIDFDDHETCLSAMRNLNGADLKGRPLRVDVASNKPVDRGARGGGPQQGGRPQQGGAPPPRGGQDRRPSSPPRDKAAEAWARMLGELPEERVTVMHEGELWQLVSNAQPLVATDVDAARRALVAKPTAALALLRAQIRLGMVSGQAISAVMAREQQQQAAAAAPGAVSAASSSSSSSSIGSTPGRRRATTRRTCSSSSSSSSGAGRRRSSTAGRRRAAAGSSSRRNTTSSSSRGRADRSTRSRRRSCSRCRC